MSPASPLVAAAASRLSPPDGCVLAASLCYAMCKVRRLLPCPSPLRGLSLPLPSPLLTSLPRLPPSLR